MKKKYIFPLIVFLAFAVSVVYLCKNYHLTIHRDEKGRWEWISVWHDIRYSKTSTATIWQFTIPARFWNIEEWKEHNKAY